MMKIDPELRAFLAGLVADYQHALLNSTQTTERLTNGIVNSVLEVATRVIPAAPNPYLTMEFGATAGSIEVVNHGTNTMTVASGGGSGTMPLGGTGVSRVDPGMTRVIHVNSRMIVIYGTPGDYVGYQAFTRGSVARSGLGAVDGGAP